MRNLRADNNDTITLAQKDVLLRLIEESEMPVNVIARKACTMTQNIKNWREFPNRKPSKVIATNVLTALGKTMNDLQ